MTHPGFPNPPILSGAMLHLARPYSPILSEIIPWASYQIRKTVGCAWAGNAGNASPRRWFKRKPLVSDPGMHHGTCVTHVPWCIPGSLTCGHGENVPGNPDACAHAILRIWQEAHATISTRPHTLHFGATVYTPCMSRRTSNIRHTKSQNLNVFRLVLARWSRMRMLLEQRRQAMLQRHLSDKNCITHEDASYIK